MMEMTKDEKVMNKDDIRSYKYGGKSEERTTSGGGMMFPNRNLIQERYIEKFL
jgi:hypothetical protein